MLVSGSRVTRRRWFLVPGLHVDVGFWFQGYTQTLVSGSRVTRRRWFLVPGLHADVGFWFQGYT